MKKKKKIDSYQIAVIFLVAAATFFFLQAGTSTTYDPPSQSPHPTYNPFSSPSTNPVPSSSPNPYASPTPTPTSSPTPTPTPTPSEFDESSYNFLIYRDSSNVYLKRNSDSSVLTTGTALQTFSSAVTYAVGGHSVGVKSGTYTLTNTLQIGTPDNQKSGISWYFQPGAKITISDHLDKSVITCSGSDLTFDGCGGGIIDGNGANQNDGTSSGIVFYSNTAYSHCEVTNFHITNCARDGFVIFDASMSQPATYCGIKNSLIDYCHWNGITVAATSTTTSSYDCHHYAINNEVAHCSDVGITSYASGFDVEDNYVHDMDGVWNTQAGYALAIEGYSNMWVFGTSFKNNDIVNCKTGLDITSYGQNTLVESNHISNTVIGILDRGSYNTITQNTISNWGSGYAFGMAFYYGQANTVTSNTISTSSSSSASNAIYCYSRDNDEFSNNQITALANSGVGVWLEADTNSVTVQQNTIAASIGIKIATSDCNSNQLIGNNLGGCATPYSDGGTGTIVS